MHFSSSVIALGNPDITIYGALRCPLAVLNWINSRSFQRLFKFPLPFTIAARNMLMLKIHVQLAFTFEGYSGRNWF